MADIGEQLRQAMRRWATGVSIVTSQFHEARHGMTVNSFTSVSLDPPHVTVTMTNWTRTFRLTSESGVFGVTILSDTQRDLADRFAGRVPETFDRFSGLETFTLVTGAPLLSGGLAHFDCRVVHTYPMRTSTLVVGEVLATQCAGETNPLIYFNRSYFELAK